MQRRHLPSINELELLYKVVEVLEAGVEMRFLSKRNDLVEVGVVYMCVYSKQSFKDVFYDLLEVLREGHVHTRRENGFIVEYTLGTRNC